ncbi:MAG: acyltransferase [Desulfobacterales bacterium]|nr:acyltransferase [Desulfobacterales bacterium]
MSAWSRAMAMAADTPPSRNRYVDWLRALSISAVVLGHWLIAAPWISAGQLRLDHMLAVQPWTTMAHAAVPGHAGILPGRRLLERRVVGRGATRRHPVRHLGCRSCAAVDRPRRAADPRLGRARLRLPSLRRQLRDDQARLDPGTRADVVPRGLPAGGPGRARDARRGGASGVWSYWLPVALAVVATCCASTTDIAPPSAGSITCSSGSRCTNSGTSGAMAGLPGRVMRCRGSPAARWRGSR